MIRITAAEGLSDKAKAELAPAIEDVNPMLRAVVPDPDDAIVALHHALALVANPERWTTTSALNDNVAVLSDGKFLGVAGTHNSFACPWCGSHGPWDGIICRSCNLRSEPD